MATIGTPRSAAERSVSPAKTPRPPLYVGTACSRQISIEKYATVELIETKVICMPRVLRIPSGGDTPLTNERFGDTTSYRRKKPRGSETVHYHPMSIPCQRCTFGGLNDDEAHWRRHSLWAPASESPSRTSSLLRQIWRRSIAPRETIIARAHGLSNTSRGKSPRAWASASVELASEKRISPSSRTDRYEPLRSSSGSRTSVSSHCGPELSVGVADWLSRGATTIARSLPRARPKATTCAARAPCTCSGR